MVWVCPPRFVCWSLVPVWWCSGGRTFQRWSLVQGNWVMGHHIQKWLILFSGVDSCYKARLPQIFGLFCRQLIPLLFLFPFLCAWYWTQGLTHSKHALYHWTTPLALPYGFSTLLWQRATTNPHLLLLGDLKIPDQLPTGEHHHHLWHPSILYQDTGTMLFGCWSLQNHESNKPIYKVSSLKDFVIATGNGLIHPKNISLRQKKKWNGTYFKSNLEFERLFKSLLNVTTYEGENDN